MELIANRRVATPPTGLIKLTFLFLLLFFAFPLMSSLAETPSTAVPDAIVQQEQLLLQRLNEVRASHGLAPVTANPLLNSAARGHVTEARSRNWMSHFGANGSTYTDRIVGTGYVPATTNEIIGWGYNMERQITWWLNSPVHRRIILSPDYVEVGLGYSGDPSRTWGHLWVVNWATHK